MEPTQSLSNGELLLICLAVTDARFQDLLVIFIIKTHQPEAL